MSTVSLWLMEAQILLVSLMCFVQFFAGQRHDAELLHEAQELYLAASRIQQETEEALEAMDAEAGHSPEV